MIGTFPYRPGHTGKYGCIVYISTLQTSSPRKNRSHSNPSSGAMIRAQAIWTTSSWPRCSYSSPGTS